MGFEDGAATDGAHFDAGHGDGDLETAMRAEGKGVLEHQGGIEDQGLTTHFFMMVIQLLLSTFCAGSWPVARKMAEMILEA